MHAYHLCEKFLSLLCFHCLSSAKVKSIKLCHSEDGTAIERKYDCHWWAINDDCNETPAPNLYTLFNQRQKKNEAKHQPQNSPSTILSNSWIRTWFRARIDGATRTQSSKNGMNLVRVTVRWGRGRTEYKRKSRCSIYQWIMLCFRRIVC